MSNDQLTLYLVRHGVTDWNREERLQGHTDVPLSDEGTAQARLLRRRLGATEIDAVWSSDLLRAVQTAEAIAQPHGLQVTRTAALRESGLGDWEGLTVAEIIARGDESLWNAYRRDATANRPPGGERLESVWERLAGCLVDIRECHMSGNIVVVGHGGSLRAIISQAVGGDIDVMRRFRLDNASLTIVEFAGQRSWLRLLNDTCHLNVAADDEADEP